MTEQEKDAEIIRLKGILQDEEIRWKKGVETGMKEMADACKECNKAIGSTVYRNTGRIDALIDTVYGNDKNGIPGLKSTVIELKDIVVGSSAKNSGLQGAVKKLSIEATKKRGGWNVLVLEAGILVALITIAIGVWQGYSFQKANSLQQQSSHQINTKP